MSRSDERGLLTINHSEAPALPAIPTTLDLFHELKYMFSSAITTMPARTEQHKRCLEYCNKLCADAKVFHWPLIFENIFNKGGFDCVLANPPWERIKIQEEEFFASRNITVANASNKAERNKYIDLLKEGRLSSTFNGFMNEVQTETEKRLYKEFENTKRNSEASSNYLHIKAPAGRYPLTGVGDVNTYAVFSETITRLVAPAGRAGFIVPSGIATDNFTKKYFNYITSQKLLISLYEFQNKGIFFTDVGDLITFCLLTLGKENKTPNYMCFLEKTEEIKDERRKFTLSPEEFELINPNTLNCPVFRSKYDAELTKKIYHNVPVLILEEQKELSTDSKKEIIKREGKNPWNISFLRMFDMSNDSNLFLTTKIDNSLPLYEAKLIHQFDHRWARYVTKNNKPTVIDITDEQKADPNYEITPKNWVEEKYVLAKVADVPDDFANAYKKDDFALIGLLLANWLYSSTQGIEGVFNEESEDGKLLQAMLNDLIRNGKKSKHYLEKFQKKAADYPLDVEELNIIFNGDCLDEIAYQLMKHRSPQWLMGWRDICRATDIRTNIASFIPLAGVGDTFLIIISKNKDYYSQCLLLADQNSLVYDYCAKQKNGGTHIKYHVKKQLPILPPKAYDIEKIKYIVPRIIELTYTSNSMRPWAEDVYNSAPEELKAEILRFCNVTIDSDGLFKPFIFNPERRAHLRAELDAYYAKLYGLTRDELRYILDPTDIMGNDYPSITFQKLKDSEIAKYGTYRTRDLILAAYDKIE